MIQTDKKYIFREKDVTNIQIISPDNFYRLTFRLTRLIVINYKTSHKTNMSLQFDIMTVHAVNFSFKDMNILDDLYILT